MKLAVVSSLNLRDACAIRFWMWWCNSQPLFELGGFLIGEYVWVFLDWAFQVEMFDLVNSKMSLTEWHVVFLFILLARFNVLRIHEEAKGIDFEVGRYCSYDFVLLMKCQTTKCYRYCCSFPELIIHIRQNEEVKEKGYLILSFAI